VRKHNLGLFQSIEVAPAVSSSRAEEVLVVRSDKPTADNKPS
jgi:hypothetical protein